MTKGKMPKAHSPRDAAVDRGQFELHGSTVAAPFDRVERAHERRQRGFIAGDVFYRHGRVYLAAARAAHDDGRVLHHTRFLE